MQKPLAPQHRLPAKLALFRALESERPDFFVELQPRASESAVKGLGANDEQARPLEQQRLESRSVWGGRVRVDDGSSSVHVQSGNILPEAA